MSLLASMKNIIFSIITIFAIVIPLLVHANPPAVDNNNRFDLLKVDNDVFGSIIRRLSVFNMKSLVKSGNKTSPHMLQLRQYLSKMKKIKEDCPFSTRARFEDQFPLSITNEDDVVWVSLSGEPCVNAVVEMADFGWENGFIDKKINVVTTEIPTAEYLIRARPDKFDVLFSLTDLKLLLLHDLTSLRDLKSMKIQLDAKIKGKDVGMVLGHELPKLHQLTWLHVDLGNSAIGNDGTIAFVAALRDFKQLKYLHLLLKNCDIGNYGLAGYGYVLERMKQLEIFQIDFKNNPKIQSAGLKAFSRAFAVMDHLKELSIDFSNPYKDNHRIGFIGFKSFADNLKGLTSLTHLNLDISHIGKDKAVAVIRGLRQLVSLTNLDLKLNDNKLHYNDALELAETLKSLDKLCYLKLDIAGNGLSSESAAVVEEALLNLNHLRSLDIQVHRHSVREEDRYFRTVSQVLEERSARVEVY